MRLTHALKLASGIVASVALTAVVCDAQAAVVYCKKAGIPKGCVARPAKPVVVKPGVGAPGVGVRPGTPENRGGPVDRVGRR